MNFTYFLKNISLQPLNYISILGDSFANPQPPSNYVVPHSKEEKLTNDDFRKLLMTPGVSSVREKVPLSTRVDMTSHAK